MENKRYIPFSLNIESLAGQAPEHILLHHGPTKLMVDDFHYHIPLVGIVASYSPKAHDVKDHFNIFRGVDMIESFAQSTICALGVFEGFKKHNQTPEELKDVFVPYFISVGSVYFQGYLEKGDTFINIGHMKFYKFRQMVCDGRTYKVPEGLDLNEYFKDFTKERLLKYDLSSDFKLIAEYFDITGRAIKLDTLIR